MKKQLLPVFIFLISIGHVSAQCLAGEVEVGFTIHTDAYGNELYWQLVPAGNACNSGQVASGGNTLVGCNGGNAQNNPTGGYASNTTINAGTWCLTQGAGYDLLMVDDWDDGANRFEISINGYPMYDYTTQGGTGGDEKFTFIAAPPLAYNMGVTHITTPRYVFFGLTEVKGTIKNFSANTINSFTLNYSVNNGAAVSSNLTGLNIPPFTTYDYVHPTLWSTPDTGEHSLRIWATNLNGNTDMDLSNDALTENIVVLPPVPDLIDQYLTTTPVLTNIITAANSVSVPRDLDFHPDLRRYELWTILKETENTGGKTITVYNAGKQNQTSILKQDGNAWHFMSLSTAIAFSDNGNFATSPGVYDANHDGGMPFTGPALWSSDPAIYAQPSGLNGSHYDMLHESPYSMGICHEKDNAFWVMDANSSDVVRYDFRGEHVPGGSDHSDGIIWRYPDINFQHDPNYHVPSHCVLDKNTNWLYMVDFGGKRVIKMDITSGTPGSALTPHEATAEYRNYNNPNFSVAIDNGLDQPCGIEVFKNRLLVSDYANGDIRIYDITGGNAAYLGKVQTGAAGIMGIKVGPDGKIWYVNATQNRVVRIDGPAQITNQLNCDSFCVVSVTYDAGYLDVTILNKDTNHINYPIVQVIAANGDTVANEQRSFNYYAQMPNSSQVYHIPTQLTSFPSNFSGHIRLEDGLFHNACIIGFCNGIISSIKETNDLAVQIYPNPASNRVYITSSSSLANAFITLHDLQGRKLAEWKSTSELILPSGISKGMYLLRIKSAELENTFKLQVE